MSSGSAAARVAAVTPGVGRGKPGIAVSSQTAAMTFCRASSKSTGVTLGEADQSRKAYGRRVLRSKLSVVLAGVASGR